MRKSFVAAAVVLAAQSLFSCSDDETVRDGSGHGQIVARIEQSSTTRTAVGDAVDGTNAVGIVWTDGDEIGVFDASGASQKRYAKVGRGTVAVASFAASGTAPFDSPVYAYYPYSESNSSNDINSLTGILLSVQNMDNGTLQGDYKIGCADIPTADGGYEFVFKHLFSMARITIDASGTPLKGETLKSLTMSVSRGEAGVSVAGGFTFSAEDGRWEQNDEGSSSITLAWDTTSPSLDQEFTCYMNLFPLVRAGDLFTITVTTENYKAEFTATSLTDFSPEQIYNFPVVLDKYETIKVYDTEGNAVRGRFTCATLNVDGLPAIANSDGPGAEGTSTLGRIMNGLGYDFIAVSEDFEYHDELAAAMADYDMGKYRGKVWNIFGQHDTDGLGFFWKKEGIKAKDETMVQFTDAYGGIDAGANTLIKKGFRHYVVTVAEGVTVDVYITHMNTFGDGGNTEKDPHVAAQMSQLRQLRDTVVARAKTNKRPAIIMGDTNMRYTRHRIVDNLIEPVEAEGFQIADPWVELHRGGVYPTWDTKSLMIRSKFAGDNENDILCADDQRGEVVDKMWYINVPGAAVQLEAASCMNEVEHFASGTETASYSGVTVETADGTMLYNQSVEFTKVNGYADHFPVVVTFEYTRTGGNQQNSVKEK